MTENETKKISRQDYNAAALKLRILELEFARVRQVVEDSRGMVEAAMQNGRVVSAPFDTAASLDSVAEEITKIQTHYELCTTYVEPANLDVTSPREVVDIMHRFLALNALDILPAELTDAMSDYAMHMLGARHQRLSGNIQRAIELEAEGEKIYNQLPLFLRW